MAESLHGDFSNAVDLADYLVRRGVPFRSAHEAVGRLVQHCIREGKLPGELSAEELTSFSEKFDASAVSGEIKASVEARDVRGSTSPNRLAEQISEARQALGRNLIQDIG